MVCWVASLYLLCKFWNLCCCDYIYAVVRAFNFFYDGQEIRAKSCRETLRLLERHWACFGKLISTRQWVVYNISSEMDTSKVEECPWKTTSDLENLPWASHAEMLRKFISLYIKDHWRSINDIIDVVSLSYGTVRAILTFGFFTTTMQLVIELSLLVNFSSNPTYYHFLTHPIRQIYNIYGLLHIL